MVAPIVKSLCLKLLFPAALLFAAFIRPCIVSSVYVLLALICPLLPSIEATLPLQPGTRGFVIVSLLYCVLASIAQIAYQIYEVVQRPQEATYLSQCNNTDIQWLRYSGFLRFHAGDKFESSRSILPEITAFAASLLTFILVSVLPHRDEELDIVGNIQQIRSGETSPSVVQTDATRRGFSQLSMALRRVTNVLIIVLAAVVGSIQPSLLNLSYFLAFLFIASWWALYKPLRHGKYNTIKRILLFWSVTHFLAIYLYQIPVVQSWIPPGSFAARLIGLSELYTNSCSRWWAYPFNESNEWPAYANPISVLVFYQLLVFQLCFTKNGSRTYFDDGTEESSVHEELLAGDENDATGEDQGEEAGGIPLRKVTSKVVDRHKISQILMGERALSGNETASEGLVTVFLFLLQHAYTLSLVSIMVWALIYHSIFGLILLAIGCILWIFKDTRKACFRLAPVLLLYIEFLLLVQYVCSMQLHDDELIIASWLKMFGVILAGDMEHAFVTLVVKVTVAVFRWLSHKLVGLWIFVVAGVLLIVATQNHPVIYSIGFFVIWSLLIIYVKISLRFFRGIAYLFWLGTVIYTSVVIISLYVYQFPEFPNQWIKWTGLNKQWNDDIGLIHYASLGGKSSLFYRLLWPICLFLVTTLQLKFFHGSWMEMVHATPDVASDPVEEGTVFTTSLAILNFVLCAFGSLRNLEGQPVVSRKC